MGAMQAFQPRLAIDTLRVRGVAAAVSAAVLSMAVASTPFAVEAAVPGDKADTASTLPRPVVLAQANTTPPAVPPVQPRPYLADSVPELFPKPLQPLMEGLGKAGGAVLRLPLNIARGAGEVVRGVGRDGGTMLRAMGGLVDTVGLAGPVLKPLPTLQPATGVVDTTQALTLLQAWQAAMLNDPTLRAARAAAAAGRERVPQARAQMLPSVQYSASRFTNQVERDQLNTLNQPLSTVDRYFSSNETLQLRQPLFRQQLHAQLRQAGFVVDEAEATLARETQNLAVRLAGAYFEAMLARDQLALVMSQQQFLTTQLDAARKALTAGVGTRTDVDEAQARLDLNKAQELEALQQVEFSRRQLSTLVNRPIGALATLEPERLVLAPPQPASVEDWVTKALAASPEVRALQAQLGQAREEISKSRSAHLPTLDLVAQTQRSRSENVTSPQSTYTNTSVGLQLNLPLYGGGYVNSITRQASAEAERVAEQLEALRLDLGVRVHKEYRGVTEGVARVKALEVAVRSADVALDSARKSLAAGVRTTQDVLNAEQQRSQVLRDLAQARYLMLVSLVRLQALSGQVDEAAMARVGAALGS